MRLIVATRNPAKVEQIARLVGDLATVEPLPPDGDDAPEDAHTLEENAIAKAVFWSRRIDRGELVAATDGGLLIPALGNRWDPVQTRRFAGAVGDLDRARALLALAHDLTGDGRRIDWQEALALGRDGTLLASWVATGVPGLLARDVDPGAIAAGQGFWIPALWICPESGGRRLAELSAEELASRPDHWWRLGTVLRASLASVAA
jgi:inosine/xanthosine triphosphate pyrophosphatase family protein